MTHYYSLCMRIYNKDKIVFGVKISEDVYAKYFDIDILQVKKYIEPKRQYW